jgi:CBS domain-containing protein
MVHTDPKLEVASIRRRQLRRRGALGGNRRVSEVMTRQLITVTPHTLAVHAQRLASANGVHHLLVVDGVRLEGVLCLCDLSRGAPRSVAADLMTAWPATVDSLAPASEAAQAMRDLTVGCLPVLDGERLVGMVTRGDLRRCGFFEDEEETRVCAACGTRHHVRCDGEAIVAFCLECIERGRAFDVDDPFEDGGGQG